MATYREYAWRLEQMGAEATQMLIALSYDVSTNRSGLTEKSRDKLTLMIHEKMMEGVQKRRQQRFEAERGPKGP